jgi:hypothetical protein
MKQIKRAKHLAETLALLSVLSPMLARASTLDAQLDCKSSAHAFIAPLQESHELETVPMRVEPNSINAFKPTRGSHLTAFDFSVYALVGYQKDDAIFKQGDGEPISDSAYGAVVIGKEEAVREKVRATGSDAIVHHVAPFITAIFCNPN